MKNHLPVTVIDPLEQARCAARIERRCLGILVEVGEALIRGGSGQ
jgi:hypothetical protein